MNPTTEVLPEPDARTCFIIYGALTFATLIYVAIAYIMEASRIASKIAPPTPPPAGAMLMGSIAVVSIIASIIWMLVRSKGRVEASMVSGGPTRMTPQEMQTNMIVALALAEMSAICGLTYFFVGGSAASILPYAAATLAVDIVIILPIITRYWKSKSRGEFEGPEITIK